MTRQTNNSFIFGTCLIFLALLACTPNSSASPSGGAPAPGSGAEIDTAGGADQVGQLTDAVAGASGEIDLDTDQIADAVSAASEQTGSTDIDTEQITDAVSAVSEQTDSSDIDTSDIDAGLLTEKFSAAVPDENGNISVTVTEEETNQALQAALAVSGTDVVSNVYIAYSGGNVVFTGDLEMGSVRAALRPYVANNTLQFEIIEASLNGTPLPPAMYAAVETTINSTLSQAMGQIPDNVQLTGVSVGEGTLTLAGTISQ